MSSIESLPTSAMARRRGVRTPTSRACSDDEGLVLDRATQRDEGPLVADVLQPEVAVEAEQEIGRALLGAVHLDQDLAAVVEGGGGNHGELDGCASRPVPVPPPTTSRRARGWRRPPPSTDADRDDRRRAAWPHPPRRPSPARGTPRPGAPPRGRSATPRRWRAGSRRPRRRLDPTNGPRITNDDASDAMPAAVIVPPTFTPALGELVRDLPRLVLVQPLDGEADETARDDVGEDQIAEEPESPQQEGHGEDPRSRRSSPGAGQHPRGGVRPEARGS